jgi:hypothetical protein
MNRRELFASTAKAAAAAALGSAELAPRAATLAAVTGTAAALAPENKAEAAGLVSPAEAQATKPPNIVIADD